MVTTRLPILKDLLQLILSEFKKMFADQPYLEKLYLAMCSSAYYGLLQIREITQGPHILLASNVHVGVNKQKMLFILRSSKIHDKGMQPQLIKINSVKTTKKQKSNKPCKLQRYFCPYQLLRDFVAARPHAKSELEQFFIFSDGSPLKPEHFRNTLHMAIARIGLDANLYKVHSLRIGRSCDLFALEVSVETIKKLGHWKSNTVFRYIRI